MEAPVNKNSVRNPEKRRQTLIEKYGSIEAYNRIWFSKRTATLKSKLGESGYIEAQKEYGARGGKKSRKHKRRSKR
jgi:hypothetical protein